MTGERYSGPWAADELGVFDREGRPLLAAAVPREGPMDEALVVACRRARLAALLPEALALLEELADVAALAGSIGEAQRHPAWGRAEKLLVLAKGLL